MHGEREIDGFKCDPQASAKFDQYWLTTVKFGIKLLTDIAQFWAWLATCGPNLTLRPAFGVRRQVVFPARILAGSQCCLSRAGLHELGHTCSDRHHRLARRTRAGKAILRRLPSREHPAEMSNNIPPSGLCAGGPAPRRGSCTLKVHAKLTPFHPFNVLHLPPRSTLLPL